MSLTNRYVIVFYLALMKLELMIENFDQSLKVVRLFDDTDVFEIRVFF